MTFAANIIKVFESCSQGKRFGQIRSDLLSDLEEHSHTLADISSSFRNRTEKLEIITFYETKITAASGSSCMQVPICRCK